MSILSLEDLGVTLGAPLFTDLSLTVHPGDRIGLVAANGRVDIVLDDLAIPAELRDRPLRALSGGWRRMAMLARVWVTEPDLLLMDEPTNHPTSRGRRRWRRSCSRARRARFSSRVTAPSCGRSATGPGGSTASGWSRRRGRRRSSARRSAAGAFRVCFVSEFESFSFESRYLPSQHKPEALQRRACQMPGAGGRLGDIGEDRAGEGRMMADGAAAVAARSRSALVAGPCRGAVALAAGLGAAGAAAGGRRGAGRCRPVTRASRW